MCMSSGSYYFGQVWYIGPEVTGSSSLMNCTIGEITEAASEMDEDIRISEMEDRYSSHRNQRLRTLSLTTKPKTERASNRNWG